jgi:aminopeptidase-like protein
MSRDRADAMMALVRALQPLCRSITGDGVRETLRIIGEEIALERFEVPTGSPALDWTVPREWNLADAWIKDRSGRRVVDLRTSNLHVVSYSTPVAPRWLTRSELEPHLHSLPEHPDWIPYRTTYYAEDWGFCLTQRQREAMTDDAYEVCIDARLEPGALSYAECFVPGESGREILISTHVCHPTLANDNLSGIAVAVELARRLRAEQAAGRRRALGYRFLFAPGTIGALVWLERNRDRLDRIAGGLTLVCLGDAADLTYKQTFAGDREIDRAMARVLAERGRVHTLEPFHPYGYDERQYNSPGFRLPVGSLMRGRHGEFPEYHTSADDLAFVRPGQLADAVECLESLFAVLEGNRRLSSRAPFGEPQLGRRGLYSATGGSSDPQSLSRALLWVLQFADGEHDLIEVARRSELPMEIICRAADALEAHGLVERVAAFGGTDHGIAWRGPRAGGE